MSTAVLTAENFLLSGVTADPGALKLKPKNNNPVPDPVEPKKSNHQANIVRISDLRAHPNADSLDLIVIGGYQVVVRKGTFRLGDLGVYIQPDSVVPQTEPFRFIWEQYVGLDGKVPEKRRRITVRKFRGEWSEGLLLPLADFSLADRIIGADGRTRNFLPEEGDDVSDLFGITHYNPDTEVASTKGDQVAAPRRKYPKTLKGWFFWLLFTLGFRTARKSLAQEVSFHLPEYDVDAFKNHANTFDNGELVVITEKIHGSNARFVCIDDTMYTGSRTQWKAPGTNTVWERALKEIPWIEAWCRQNPGYTLYGEVTPTQKGFDYGSKDVQFFLFDILDPDGNWIELYKTYPMRGGEDESVYYFPVASDGVSLVVGSDTVPVLYVGPYSMEVALKYVDGPSQVQGAGHVREGVVIQTVAENGRLRHGRKKLKIVSNHFLERDGKS